LTSSSPAWVLTWHKPTCQSQWLVSASVQKVCLISLKFQKICES
jgi:hypothetical protein